jgi:hypothetical protein
LKAMKTGSSNCRITNYPIAKLASGDCALEFLRFGLAALQGRAGSSGHGICPVYAGSDRDRVQAGHHPVTGADRALDTVLRQHLLRGGEGWLSGENVDDPIGCNGRKP